MVVLTRDKDAEGNKIMKKYRKSLYYFEQGMT